MPHDTKLPSKWWFWCVPAVANLYCVTVISLGPLIARVTGSFMSPRSQLFLWAALYGPLNFFIGHIAEPLRLWLVGGVSENPWLFYLASWELSSAILGLSVWGLALLWHVLVRTKDKGTEEEA